MIRRWMLRHAELALADARWYRKKWIDGWNSAPSEIAASDRKIARLERRVANLTAKEASE